MASPFDPSDRRPGSVVGGCILALTCWVLSIVPLVVSVLTLLCDVDGRCTPEDTRRRYFWLAVAVAFWLMSGPAAAFVGRRRWLLAASAVPLLPGMVLIPWFLAGP